MYIALTFWRHSLPSLALSRFVRSFVVRFFVPSFSAPFLILFRCFFLLFSWARCLILFPGISLVFASFFLAFSSHFPGIFFVFFFLILSCIFPDIFPFLFLIFFCVFLYFPGAFPGNASKTNQLINVFIPSSTERSPCRGLPKTTPRSPLWRSRSCRILSSAPSPSPESTRESFCRAATCSTL